MLLRVRIIRKLADVLNGVDVSRVQEGECVDLPPQQARMLIAEGWAELTDPYPIDARLPGCRANPDDGR